MLLADVCKTFNPEVPFIFFDGDWLYLKDKEDCGCYLRAKVVSTICINAY